MSDTNTSIDLRATLPDPSDIRKVADAYNEMADSEDKAALARERLNDAAAKPVNAPPVIDRTARSPAQPSGPFSRASNANDRYKDAIDQLMRDPSSTSQNAFNDALYNRNVAQTRLARITGTDRPDLNKAVSEMLSTSRFGGGSGMMPLMGKVEGVAKAALGPELAAIAGPVGIATTAFVEAAKAVHQFSAEAAASGRHMAEIRFMTGASNAEASKLNIYSKAFGTDFSGMAQSLNERITTDPTARAYASQFGAYNVAGNHSKVDVATDLIKVIEGLRSITDQQERIRTAKILGVTNALPMAEVGSGTFKQLKMDAEVSSMVIDPKFQKDSAEFGVASGRVKSGWDVMTASMSKNFFPIVIPAMHGIADAEYALAAFMSGDLKNSVKYAGKSLAEFGVASFNTGVHTLNPGGPARLKPFIENYGGKENGSGDTPVSANTAALLKATQALAALTHALGGGERAKGAIPGGLTTEHYARPDEMRALRLGPLA